MNDHLFGKELFIRFTVRDFRERLSMCVCVCPSFFFVFAGGMWGMIVFIPYTCLSIFDYIVFWHNTAFRNLPVHLTETCESIYVF